MLKQLKFDCYKIFHSWMMRIVLIVCFILCVLNPILTNIASSESLHALLCSTSSQTFVIIATFLFTVFLVGIDFSSGYIKNIYASSNRVAYIFSKVICIFVFVIAFQVAYYLLSMLFCVAFGSGIIYDKPHAVEGGSMWGDTFNIGLSYYHLFADGSMAFTYSMLVMFLLFATKNQWAALIAGILYFFLGRYLDQLFNTLIMKMFRLKYEFHIERYLVLQFDYFDNWATMNLDKLITKSALIFSGVMTFYSALAIGCSFPVFMARKVKV